VFVNQPRRPVDVVSLNAEGQRVRVENLDRFVFLGVEGAHGVFYRLGAADHLLLEALRVVRVVDIAAVIGHRLAGTKRQNHQGCVGIAPSNGYCVC